MKSRSLLRSSLALTCAVIFVTSGYAGGLEPPPPADLTKPNNFPKNTEAWLFPVGPTGMYGIFVGGPKYGELKGQQILVRSVDKGSPADGKIVFGDVIIGVNGKRFSDIKGNIIVSLGNAIDEAEKEENKGKLALMVFRDLNFKKRYSSQNMNIKKLDLNKFFKVVEADTAADLERYKSEHQIKQSVNEAWREGYKKFPLKPSIKEVVLTLEVMGSYSATSPWDCPKVKKIREQAYPHLEPKVQGKKGMRGWRIGTTGLALLASGRPEHLEMVKKAVHKNPAWMSGKEPGGGSSWFNGYELFFLGEYYLRTKDPAILPGLAAYARHTAKLQSYGGTWGHGGASRAQNFGELFGPCPGYGAMNQAGGVCFFGLTLAQKAGINDSLVNEAIRRATKFDSTYVDKGGVPYGFHGAVMYGDSNGKNGPPGLAMRVLGEYEKAKYFALTCAVASSWGYRGGHGDGTFGNYWPPLCSSMAGKEAVQIWWKKMQPYYTMARRWDGSFVSVSNGGSLGIGCLFDPTAMYLLHLSIPMHQLYITGKGQPPQTQATARDIMHLKDCIGVSGFNFREAKTDEILSRLDTFSTQLRRDKKKGYLGELVKRYKAGEKSLVPKLVKLLNHDNYRVREAALYTLQGCGKEPSTLALPRAIELLRDKREIVRMAAVGVVRSFGAIPQTEAELAMKHPPPQEVDLTKILKPLFEASLRHYPTDTNDNVNTPYVLMQLLINTKSSFARDPFGQGQDPELVRRVLERFLRLDPRESVMRGPSRNWDRETCIKIAGPLMFTASNRSKNGIMFSGGALAGGQALLLRHKFVEGIEAGCMDCKKIARCARVLRPKLQASGRHGGWIAPGNILKYKGVGKNAIPWLRAILVERMNLKEKYGKSGSYLLYDAIKTIEDNPTPEGWSSLRDAAMKAFWAEADAKGGKDAQIKFCRSVLEPERTTWFRQMAAMTRLVELLGSDAISDLAPYLNSRQWRFSDHSRELLTKLKAPGVAPALVKLAGSEDDRTAIGALLVLAARGDKEAEAVGKKLLADHENGFVRGAAAQAICGATKGKAFMVALNAMKEEDDPQVLEEFEKALLLNRADETNAKAVAEASKKAVPASSIPVRRSLYYVIAQIGGSDNLRYLKNLVGTENKEEFNDILEAVSWSPDTSATQVLLQILKDHQGTYRALAISKISEKRMINGGKELGKVPDDVNLDFAEQHLKVVRNTAILKYLGNISTGRSIELLLKYMKLGPANVTLAAGSAIPRAASGLSLDLPVEDRKKAAEALTQYLEYIKTVHTSRGPLGEGLTGRQRKGYVLAYPTWKGRADRTGAILNRLYKPEEEGVAPVEEDLDDIDI